MSELHNQIEVAKANLDAAMKDGNRANVYQAAWGIVEMAEELAWERTELTQRLDEYRQRVADLESAHNAAIVERDTLRAKLDDLLSQRMDEAEAKLATRPAEAVVGELQAENRRLREVAERVVRANKDVENHGYASLRRMVYALEAVLKEVEGGARHGG